MCFLPGDKRFYIDLSEFRGMNLFIHLQYYYLSVVVQKMQIVTPWWKRTVGRHYGKNGAATFETIVLLTWKGPWEICGPRTVSGFHMHLTFFSHCSDCWRCRKYDTRLGRINLANIILLRIGNYKSMKCSRVQEVNQTRVLRQILLETLARDFLP